MSEIDCRLFGTLNFDSILKVLDGKPNIKYLISSIDSKRWRSFKNGALPNIAVVIFSCCVISFIHGFWFETSSE